MKTLIAAFALSLAPGIAAAGAYDVLSWKPDRLAAVDRESLSEADGMKRVRITVIYAAPRSDRAQPYRGLVGLQEFDCAAARYRTLESAPFDDAGAPLAGSTVAEPTAWTPVTPNTLGADEMSRVCRGEWSGQTYKTNLPTLMAAFMLRPERTATEAPTLTASAAEDHAIEASVAPHP